MSDTTQGQDVQDTLSDHELFQGAVESATLDKFENPELPKPEPKPADKAPVAEKPTDKEQPDAPVPAGRLREESEARRRAESERDTLRARLAAFETQPRQQQVTQPAKVDIFDNPSDFVRQEVEPLIKAVQDRHQDALEKMSLDFAVSKYGDETVAAARTALVQGIHNGDPGMKAVLDRAMQTHDPWGYIVRSHRERETMGKVGGDLEAYNKSVLEKALDDPEHQRQAIERAQARAKASGSVVNRPAQSKVPNVPSLANIGAGGGDQAVQEPSDEQLFRQVTSAKRR